ncbi:exodeoxyribonuclease VII large subunit [Microbacterium halophytorum]|uniref:exodeoxyribonuclease VII large subunit n=1 Tax=Microbacterium halophytorum TaxID=2067568 RepID=UPI000CFCE597|nr:exodeoxyribonuclease VII large subunit [Microbacterium halophytorum]
MTTFSAERVPGQAPPPDSVAPNASTAEAPTSVERLGRTIRGFIERWGAVWVEGEITSWNVRAGATFGRLKDLETDAQISLRIWSSVRGRMPADLKVGDHVVANVKTDYWVKGGDLAFQVSSMRHVGLGDQLERLERLRAQLKSEGLFDPARKKQLPFLPGTIGLVTGERSDAERDVRRNAELRWPEVAFRTEYAAVQGDRSVAEVLAALERLDADDAVDVIVIARGGGDPQTLLGFSDERLLRAVAAARKPVVSAIGHENDHPLLDDVADMRASTPTDAAKRVVPDVGEQRALIAELRSRARLRLTQRVASDLTQLEQLRSRPALREPERIIRERAQDVFLQVSRGRDAVGRSLQLAEARTGELRASLRALSPASTLARGYAIAQTDDGAIVRKADQAPTGARLVVTIEHGVIAAVSHGAVGDGTGAEPADGTGRADP